MGDGGLLLAGRPHQALHHVQDVCQGAGHGLVGFNVAREPVALLRVHGLHTQRWQVGASAGCCGGRDASRPPAALLRGQACQATPPARLHRRPRSACAPAPAAPAKDGLPASWSSAGGTPRAGRLLQPGPGRWRRRAHRPPCAAHARLGAAAPATPCTQHHAVMGASATAEGCSTTQREAIRCAPHSVHRHTSSQDPMGAREQLICHHHDYSPHLRASGWVGRQLCAGARLIGRCLPLRGLPRQHHY